MKNCRLRVVLTAFLTLLCSGIVQAADSGISTKMRYGYTCSNRGYSLGYQFKIIVKGAIELPAEEMARMGDDARITALRFFIGGELSEQNNYVFITDNLDGEFLYQQQVEHLDYGWNEIALDTPFDLNGRRLFVGYRYESAGDILTLDGEADNDLANWIYVSQTGEDGAKWAHQSGGALNLQAVIEGENLPQCDVELNRHSIRKYAAVNQDVPLWVVVRNHGAATVSSIDVDVRVDGDKVLSHTVDGLQIESGELEYVNIGSISFTANNISDIAVDITAVNGSDDLRPGDNSATVQNVIIRRDYVNRSVLLEHFSTMACSNCPTAHKTIDDALRFRNDVIHVIHHAGFRTDDLTIPASESYLWFYSDGAGSGSLYAPGAMLDRTNMSAYGATDDSKSTPGPVFSPQRATLGDLIDKRLSTPALLTVGIANNYDPATRKLGVKVSGLIPNGSADRLNVSDPRLTIMLTEDGVPGTQAGVSEPLDGPYIHDCALRCVLTDNIWGDPVTFDGANYQSKEYTFEIPADWDADQLRIVAFVSDFSQKSTNNCEVLNAAQSDLSVNTGICMPEMPGSDAAAWRPAVIGGAVALPGNCLGATLYTVSGAALTTAAPGAAVLNLGDVPSGLYLIVAETPAGRLAVKIVK